jgi:hypothetical protein
MDRYLIETNHTMEDCLHVLDDFLTHGYITHYDWGCKDNVHIGWAIVEADSVAEALLSVPPIVRNKARAVKLNKFTPEDIQAIHEQMKG